MEKVLVYGAGEFGELIENLLFYKSELEITAFCDDDASLIDSDKNGKPVIAGIEAKHYGNKRFRRFPVPPQVDTYV